jgi:hypothetical protein
VPLDCPSCQGKLTELARCSQCGIAVRVGDYAIERLVSQHGHSRLYLARSSAGSAVALKELLFALVPGTPQLDAFEREARTLRRIEHPQVPRFLDSLRVGSGVDTRLYLVQEFVAGVSLADAFRRPRLSEAQLVDTARQVLGVLDYLHGRSPPIIHRDLKPANIIEDVSSKLWVVDFGAARDLPRGETHGATLVGTMGYMPPEQLGGTVDATSDLFALGATLLHGVSGKAPDELAQDPLSLAVPKGVALSSHRRRFLARLIAPKRRDRYQSAAEALRALDHPKHRRLSILAVPIIAAVALSALGAAVLRGHAPAQQTGVLDSSIEREAFAGLKGLFVAELAYYAEYNRYSSDLRRLGFTPDPWCADGARRTIPPVEGTNRAAGCHFVYQAQVEGVAPEERFVVTATGAADPATGRSYRVVSDGPDRGIPRRVAP